VDEPQLLVMKALRLPSEHSAPVAVDAVPHHFPHVSSPGFPAGAAPEIDLPGHHFVAKPFLV